MCVVGVYIRNIYYIYERFSDFRYGFGAGEFITEPNEAHTESVGGVQDVQSFFWFSRTHSACHAASLSCQIQNSQVRASGILFGDNQLESISHYWQMIIILNP